MRSFESITWRFINAFMFRSRVVFELYEWQKAKWWKSNQDDQCLRWVSTRCSRGCFWRELNKNFFSLKQSDSIVMRIICSLFICIRRKQIWYRFENKEIFIFRWRISSSDGYKTQISLFHNILQFLTFRSTKIILMLCYSQTSRRFCTVSSEDSFQSLVKWMSLNEQQDVTRKHPWLSAQSNSKTRSIWRE